MNVSLFHTRSHEAGGSKELWNNFPNDFQPDLSTKIWRLCLKKGFEPNQLLVQSHL